MPHRLLLPLLLVALSGLAQTKEPGPTIHAKFRVLSLDGPILGAGYLEGKNLRRLDISADAFTAEQTYAGGNPLRLVDVTGPAAATNRFAARQAHQEIQGRLQA
ncbi:hypothetical protein EBR16_06755, partial [bacterium]|nr:hypothetical protein [bacterium]